MKAFQLVIAVALVSPFGLGTSHICSEESPPDSPGDGRIVLRDTGTAPAMYTGLLYFDDPRPAENRKSENGSIRAGTAFLVSAQHIVTCAHCITHNPYELKLSGDKPYPTNAKDEQSKGMGFPSELYFAPGHHGILRSPSGRKDTPESQPYGRYRVIAITQIFSQYFAESEPVEISKYDMVVLKLDRSTHDSVKGHFEIAEWQWGSPKFWRSRPELNLNGYDADRSPIQNRETDDEWRKWWQISRTGQTVLPLSEPEIMRPYRYQGRLSCKAFPGASGGPVWRRDSSGNHVAIGLGVKTHWLTNDAIVQFFTEKHVEFIRAGLK